MSSGTATLQIDDDVATITLERPPLNIFDLAMRDALLEAVEAVRLLPELNAVVIRSAGDHFSAGADLSEFGTAPFPLESRRIRWDRDIWTRLWTVPIPVVAALKGHTLGAGFEIAMLCDVRIASPTTTVGLPEVDFGMLPAAGGTQTLTKLVGPDRALPTILLGRRLHADEALAMGVIHEVAPDADHRAGEVARDLAAADPIAVRRTKQQLRDAIDTPTRRPNRYDWSSR